MTFTQIKVLLEALEYRWQNALRILPGSPDARIANGQVQFFDVEDTPIPPPAEVEVPVVVAIGANYAQAANTHPWYTPYLGTYPNGSPIASTSPGSTMRRHLDQTFTAYAANPQGWSDRCLASDAQILVAPIQLPYRYLLIATNDSPFITFDAWQNYDPQYRANLLRLFRAGCDFLDEMVQVLNANGIKVLVFVAHGLHSEVPVLFRKWQMKNNLAPWIITANLGRPLPVGPNAFYNRTIPGGAGQPVQRPDIVDFIE